MGMDLALIPFGPFWRDGGLSGARVDIISSTRLDTWREYEFYAQITEEMGELGDKPVCDPQPLPKNVILHVYEDEGLKELDEDPYGEKLTYVTAGELAKTKPKTPWNKSVIAFISTLPEDMPVILWWH